MKPKARNAFLTSRQIISSIRVAVFSTLAGFTLFSANSDGATYNYIGASGSNWSLGTSWQGGSPAVNGSDLVFNGSAVFSSNDSLSTANSLSFGSSQVTTTLLGNALTVGAGGITTNSANTINLSLGSLTLGATQTWKAASGILNVDAPVALGGNTLTVDSAAETFFAHAVTGSGSIVKIGSGDLWLTGSSSVTVTGGLTVNAGTLSGTGVLSSSLNYTSLALSRFDGLITGLTSTVTVNSANISGELVLNGANSYGGLTTVTSGVLQAGISNNGGVAGPTAIGTPGALGNNSAVTVGAAGTLDIAGFNVAIGSLAGAAGGLVQSTGGAGTLTTGGLNTNTTYNGVLRDGTGGTLSLWKVGTGTQILNGINTYTGLTEVAGGTLVIGDNSTPTARIAGSALVDLGSMLAGNGTVGGNLTNKGTVAPGYNSFGTLSVGGNYAASTGTLSIQADGLAAPGMIADQLKVAGSTTLTGTTLKLVKVTNELDMGDWAQVVNTTGNNNIGQVALFDISAFNDLMLFDNHTGIVYGVGVTQSQDLSDIPGLNHNQRHIAKALSLDVLNPQHFIDDRLPLDHALLEVINASNRPGVVLNNLSPEGYAGLTDYGIQVTRNYTRTAMQMAGPVPEAEVAAPVPTDGKGGMQVTQSAVSLHTTVFGGYSHYDTASTSSNNHSDYDITSNGGIVGARYASGDFSFGGFLAYDDGRVSSNYVDADSNGFVLGGFAEYVLEKTHAVRLDGGVTYGEYSFDGHRHTMFGSASFDGVDTDVFDVFASVQGDAYKTDRFCVSPSLGLHYLHSDTDSIKEKGIGTALDVRGINDEALLCELDIKLEYKVTANFLVFGSVGYTHNFINSERQVDASFSSGLIHTPFSVIAPGLGEDFFTTGVGGVWSINNAWNISAGYRAEFGSDSKVSNSVGVGTSYSF